MEWLEAFRDEPGASPLILSFSPWEKGPLNNACDIVPSPRGSPWKGDAISTAANAAPES